MAGSCTGSSTGVVEPVSPVRCRQPDGGRPFAVALELATTMLAIKQITSRIALLSAQRSWFCLVDGIDLSPSVQVGLTFGRIRAAAVCRLQALNQPDIPSIWQHRFPTAGQVNAPGLEGDTRRAPVWGYLTGGEGWLAAVSDRVGAHPPW